MAVLTIRKLYDRVRDRLRTRAAAHGRSMEEEVRKILEAAVFEEDDDTNLADLALELFGLKNGIELRLDDVHLGMGKPVCFEE